MGNQKIGFMKLILNSLSQNSRLLSRTQCQWIKVLSGGQWEEELRDPPTWVVFSSAEYSSTIFQMAPGFWLKQFGKELLQRLLLATHHPEFQESPLHINIIEHIVRSLRNKSPWFATQPLTLAALKALNRATFNETQQLQLSETRQRLSVTGRSQSTIHCGVGAVGALKALLELYQSIPVVERTY